MKGTSAIATRAHYIGGGETGSYDHETLSGIEPPEVPTVRVL